MEMPFGKYAGTELDEIPEDYLLWVLNNVEIRNPRLLEEIEEITGEKAPTSFPKKSGWTQKANGGKTAPSGQTVDIQALHVDLIDAVDRWRRQLARQYHPDRGGDAAVLKAINTAGDDLAAAISEALKRRS